MSFYMEDDDDVGGGLQFLSQSTSLSQTTAQEEETSNFFCDNCGGSSSYLDETTGLLCCSECFTQSQQIIHASQQTLEDDDAVDLAARTRYGQLITRRVGPGKKRVRRPMEDFDQSVPLPDLEKCLKGFQRVLKEGCKRIAEILQLDNETAANMLRLIKIMWKAYLQSYADAANYYGKLHPKMRFSLRDAFLPSLLLERVLANLSYKAQEKVKREALDMVISEKGSESLDLRSPVGAFPDKPDRVESTGGHEVATPGQSMKRKSPSSGSMNSPGDSKLRRQRASNKPMERMLRTHFKLRDPIGRMEAALVVRPSMKMAAALLLVASSPFGVTDYMMLDWIDNAILPLKDSFVLLDEEQQKELRAISGFFRPSQGLTIRRLRSNILGVQVACGYESLSNGDSFWDSPRLVSSVSAPMVIARLVSDCHFGQSTLDNALSIVGATKATDTSPKALGWLPPQLKSASLEAISSFAHIAAIVIVAFKMTPLWKQELVFACPSSIGTTSYKSTDDLDGGGDMSMDPSGGNSAGLLEQVFVPNTETRLARMTNGDMKGYMKFLDDHVLLSSKRFKSVLPKFSQLLEECEEFISNGDQHESARCLEHGQVTCGYPYLLELPALANLPPHHYPLHTRDASLLGSRGSRNYARRPPECSRSTLLIDYLASMIGCKPGEIERHLVEIESELAQHLEPAHKMTGKKSAWQFYKAAYKVTAALCPQCLQYGGKKASTCKRSKRTSRNEECSYFTSSGMPVKDPID